MNFRLQRSVLTVAWCALLFLVADAQDGLDSGQKSKLFIANAIFQSIPPIVNQAWKNLRQAHERGELGHKNVSLQLLVKDFIRDKFKPIHTDLRLIDKVVLDHLPSAFLDQIVDLMELEKLQDASSLVQAKKASTVDFWKEEWVKLSSLLVQMHYRYNRVFDHAFKGSLESHFKDHYLLDDLIQILPEPPEFLAYKNRYYYAWKKMEGADRGTDNEQYAETLDEVNESAKETIETDDLKNNLFVGLRHLLDYNPNIVGPYKGIKNLTDPCWDGTKYRGLNGIDYQIPLYILLHILNAEIKYYVTQSLGEMYSCAQLNKCNFAKAEVLQKHLENYYEFYITQMIKAFQDMVDPVMNAPPEAWIYRCGPGPSPIENTSYARFYDFDTQFIAPEEDLSLTKTCRDSCDLFDGAYSSIPCADDDQSCLEIDDEFDCDGKDPAKCPGEDRKLCPHSGILCTVNEISTAKVCPSNVPGRYLDWVQTDDPLFANLGNDTKCQNEVLAYSTYDKPESSGITRYEPQHCEICVCTCYEPMTNDSHRYVSLVPIHTDIQKNRVLVGIKFVKLQNQIHIAIADADTTYTDTVQPETTKWIQPEFVPDPDNNSQKIFRLHREAKLILLDDLTAPSGYAITGVKFAPLRIPMDRLQFLELALWIHVTRITPTGKLVPEDSGWIHTNSDTRYRDRIMNMNLIPPNLAANTSLPVPYPPGPKKLLYIEVESSSLKVDAGQTPLPFFDLQQVVNAANNGLVRGIGLFYKSPPGGYGGYLGFRLLPDIIRDIPDQRFDLRYWTFQNHNLLEEWLKSTDNQERKKQVDQISDKSTVDLEG